MDVISKLPRLAETEVRGEGKTPPKSLAFSGVRGSSWAKHGEIGPNPRREWRGPGSRLTTQIRSMNDLFSRHSAGFLFVGNVPSHLGRFQQLNPHRLDQDIKQREGVPEGDGPERKRRGRGWESCAKDKKLWKKSQRFRSGRSDAASGTQELSNSIQYGIQVS